MTTATEAAARLQAALEQLVVALASGEPPAVLEAEAPLAAAARVLDAGVTPVPSAGDAAMLRVRIDDIRALLARCRALGGLSADLVAVMFPPPVYGPAARGVSARGPAASGIAR